MLIYPAALTLKYIIQQTADALGMKCHPRFPVSPPAVEGDIERPQYAVLIVKYNEFGVHIRLDFNEVMLWRAKYADQFKPGAF